MIEYFIKHNIIIKNSSGNTSCLNYYNQQTEKKKVYIVGMPLQVIGRFKMHRIW